MAELIWDKEGERTYETGVDHGVLYVDGPGGKYRKGVAWNGLVTVTESPTGAEPSPQYADNIKYLNLYSAEEFGATVEAFTYPDEFMEYDGLAEVVPGVTIGQQPRKTFGLSYRTKVGNDQEGDEYGSKIHLVWGCRAAPTEKAYGTINDSPEAITFSWELSTTAVNVPGHKPTSIMTINTHELSPGALSALEDALYGTSGSDPYLPLPGDVITIIGGGGAQFVTPDVPTFDAGNNEITIPSTANVSYWIAGVLQDPGSTYALEEDENVLVTAYPAAGYRFPDYVDNDWLFSWSV